MFKKVQEFYKNNEKYRPLMFIGGVFLVLIIGATIAFYSQELSVVNTFSTMTYNVEMEEEFYDDWGTKSVTIYNRESTNTPVALRVSYSEAWTNGEDTLNNLVNGENVVNKTWSQDFTDDFVLCDDGWYYYKKLLNGNSSVNLLQSINLDSQIASLYPEYNTYNYSLDFTYEAIQGSSVAIEDIWGYEVEIESGEITWPWEGETGD